MIVPAQIRGARGILGWSMLDLAKAAGVSISTVKRSEDGARPQSEASSRAAEAIRRAFEDHGVEFDACEGGVIVLRLNSSVRPRPITFSRFM